MRSGTKRDPVRRWSRPDRVFFGYGACHILAGVYLDRPPLEGFYAERIIPGGDRPGNHIYVTDGMVAFDYHGYAVRDRLLAHHGRVWSSQHETWRCRVERVDFDLLSTPDLNARKMLGPDQYAGDAIARARRFIARRDHSAWSAVARRLAAPLPPETDDPDHAPVRNSGAIARDRPRAGRGPQTYRSSALPNPRSGGEPG